jgi:hypothetical protein
MRPIPETYNRQDWPRLVRQSVNSLDRRVTSIEDAVNSDIEQITFPIGGQYLLSANDYNGWSDLGPYEGGLSQPLGTVGGAVDRIAGGVAFPFDVRLVRFFAWHYNSDAGALPWGWRVVRQAKVAGSNAVTFENMLDEVGNNAGVGPRDYGDSQNQLIDIAAFANDVVPAGEVVVLGVEAPTALSASNYVQIMSGYLQFERI